MVSNDRPSDEVDPRLTRCEDIIGYQFADHDLLQRCLTHSSAAPTRLESNERLEFLGDAVLGLVTCELLYRRFPRYAEGELTRLKSILVSRVSCSLICERLGLHELLFVGKGLRNAKRLPDSVKAASLETIIAGVYLDGGLEAARSFITTFLDPEVDLAVASNSRNFKSVLQQISQKRFTETPVYRLLDEQGPDHSKCFQVAAVIGSTVYPAAWGNSKKEAEQEAARQAIARIQSPADEQSA